MGSKWNFGDQKSASQVKPGFYARMHSIHSWRSGQETTNQPAIVLEDVNFQRKCGFFVSSQLLGTKICVHFSWVSLGNEWIAAEAPVQWKILCLLVILLGHLHSKDAETLFLGLLSSPGILCGSYVGICSHCKFLCFSVFSKLWGFFLKHKCVQILCIVYINQGLWRKKKTQARWFK